LDFFEHKISDYPYEKLANVQSTTRYGGMENAGCIFYSERAITGENRMEELIAHEIAHQWFGNSATESDWEHLWLSEGFATYFTNLYVQYNYGEERFTEMLKKDRKSVLQFYQQNKLPLIDTISTDLLFMLNTNAYQRGAWVLHMLGNEIGNENFWITIQKYYEEYQYKNATSSDFIKVAEEVNKRDLQLFKKQWLQTGVIPELDLNWEQKGKNVTLSIKQLQEGLLFEFPLEFMIYYKDGSSELKEFRIKDKEFILKEKIGKKIKCVQLDPNVKLLFLKR
jgi:aminopeptidase N